MSRISNKAVIRVDCDHKAVLTAKEDYVLVRIYEYMDYINAWGLVDKDAMDYQSVASMYGQDVLDDVLA